MIKQYIKNKEVFLDFDEYDAMIKSESWQLFAALTEKSL